jgi:gluconolactonase
MKIDMTAPGFERIISPDAELERLAGDFMFIEGPVWSHREGHLRFSDIPANKIYQWSPSAGLSTYREASEKSNGLTYDREGRLVSCEHVGRRISRAEADGSVSNVVSHRDGKKLNSPNDLVVKSDGSIYFTDPNYGIVMDHVGVIAPQEQDVLGIYRVDPDGSNITLLADDFAKPNGLAFSPNESRLYIVDTEKGHLRVFDVQADGGLTHGRLFADVTGDGPGRPDGMKVDSEGNVYTTGPGGVHVFSPDGERICRLVVSEKSTANLAFGDGDWKTLYFCSSDALLRVRLNIAGTPVG